MSKDTFERALEHLIEKLLLSHKGGVERHRRDPDRIRQRADGQPIQPLLINETKGTTHHVAAFDSFRAES